MNNAVKLFWTSGWDSTYRLLYLVLVAEKEVQPYYVIENKRRKSVDVEIKSMDLIREKIAEKDPIASKRILPTIYIELKDITIDQEISDAYEKITRKRILGGQYVYLASYAKRENLKAIDLSVIKSEGTGGWIATFLKEIQSDGIVNYCFSDEHKNEPAYTLFEYFNFPVIHYSKLDLGDLAREQGFIDLLELSWSCHDPLSDGTPCGVCPPCCYAIEDGFTYRFPEASLKRYQKSIKRKFNSQIRKYPGLYYFLRHTKGFIKGKKNVVN